MECCICYENIDMNYGCEKHPTCYSCIHQRQKECWKMPHRFLFCPYCRDILHNPKDDRDIIINCTDCDRLILVHKKKYLVDKVCKFLYEHSEAFQDNNLKYIRYLFENDIPDDNSEYIKFLFNEY